MKARWPFAAAGLLAGTHVVMRGLGWGAHTSVIAGMPQSEVSWLLGPMYALVWIGLVTLAPVLVFVGTAKSLMNLVKDNENLK